MGDHDSGPVAPFVGRKLNLLEEKKKGELKPGIFGVVKLFLLLQLISLDLANISNNSILSTVKLFHISKDYHSILATCYYKTFVEKEV